MSLLSRLINLIHPCQMVFLSFKKTRIKNTFRQCLSSQFPVISFLVGCLFWPDLRMLVFLMLMFCVSGSAVCALCCRFSVSVKWVCVRFRAGYWSAGLCWRSSTPEWLWDLTAHRKHTTLTPSSQTLRWYTIATIQSYSGACFLIYVYVFVF